MLTPRIRPINAVVEKLKITTRFNRDSFHYKLAVNVTILRECLQFKFKLRGYEENKSWTKKYTTTYNR